MKITVLVENTTRDGRLTAEHGLSLYIETEKHRVLFDMGQGDAFVRNADTLGIDLSSVDIAVLSHGHYDHGGGISSFFKINKKAPVCVSRYAFGEHLNAEGKYIGLNKKLAGNDRLFYVNDFLEIDEELSIYSCNAELRSYPADSAGLGCVCNGERGEDDFLHEQYLLIKEKGKRVLISGCSHKGILNICEWFRPDVLVGGFHFMKLDTEGEGREKLLAYADALSSFPTRYYTAHCTGVEQYAVLKGRMKDKLEYLSCGGAVEI